MSCSPTTASLAYLQALLARRHDIAIHPADALEHPDPPDDLYLYRPSEVLIPLSQVATFVTAARRLGVRIWRLDDGAITEPSGQGGTVRPAGPPGGEPSSEPRQVLEADRDAQAQDRQGGEADGVSDAEAAGLSEGEGEPGGDDEIACYAIGARGDLDTVLDRLIRVADGPLLATPNHVLFTTGGWALNPADEPEETTEIVGINEEGPLWDVSVAVIDGGLPLEYRHNPLLHDGVTAHGEEPWSYDGPYPVLTFPQGHGSFVAGVVRRHAALAHVRTYRAADPDGVTDEWTLAAQIDHALVERATVINLSLGAPSRHDLPLLALRRLGTATHKVGGPIVVAAAGNLDSRRKFWPAAEPWAIGVGAVDVRGPHPQRAWFSDWGTWVDACADGVKVLSSFEERPYRPVLPPNELRYFNGFATWSGTSFATPRVAAEVARLRHAHPGWLRHDVLAHLASTCPWIPGLGRYVR